MRATRELWSAAAVAAVVAMSGALAACGGGDGGGDDTAGGSDREQARATVERLYTAMEERDAAGVCAELDEAAQAQVVAGGQGAYETCAESFRDFFDDAAAGDGLNLTLKAQVMSVSIDGDTAVAKVRFGERKGSPKGDIPLAKVDGEWKLGAVGGTPAQ